MRTINRIEAVRFSCIQHTHKINTTDKVKVRVLDIKHFCSRLKGHNINLDPLKYQKLHQLEFMNDCEHDNYIEAGVLLGLDDYWDIVIGNHIRDTQNLVPLETKLGYILSGAVYTSCTNFGH